MKKFYLFLIPLLIVSCSEDIEPEEDLISLYSDTSRVYFEDLKVENSCLLKTYHHKKFGDIPYVEMGEYCETFEKQAIEDKKLYAIEDGKFHIYDSKTDGIIFDAKKDEAITSSNFSYFFSKMRRTNNGIPLDIYSKKEAHENLIKESPNSKTLIKGKERKYNFKKYNFDIVYQNGKYYAPFSVLNYVLNGHLNEAYIYNGKHFFDVDYIQNSHAPVQYCYSSKGDFLLDRSGGKLGAVLYKKTETKEENEAFRFVNTIEQSGQTTVMSCLKDGTGSIKSYDKDGKYIDDGTFIKLNYKVSEDKNEITIDYFTVLDEGDTEPISDIFSLRINLDETYFMKKTRSKEVADFTYQELRFAMYELYGNTINTRVKDFDNFIKDKDYKDDLLSLDIDKYDEAMSKFLLLDVDDAHTSIKFPSIYGEPTFAQSNFYASKYSGERESRIFSTASKNADARKEAGIHALNIVNETAFVAFSKFDFSEEMKGINEYKDEDPDSYTDKNPMELFAAAFNKIKENDKVKNVVIDLSSNTGGKTASMAYLIGYVAREPSILANLLLDGSVNDYRYQIDLDQDGKFGTESDTFEGKYKFYVLTSGGTFSCGNLFATICKNNGYAKIIGEQSGGGACIISQLCNSSGFLYCSSSEYVNILKDGNGYKHNDDGVEVDIPLESSKFYDHAYIDSILKAK